MSTDDAMRADAKWIKSIGFRNIHGSRHIAGDWERSGMVLWSLGKTHFRFRLKGHTTEDLSRGQVRMLCAALDIALAE